MHDRSALLFLASATRPTANARKFAFRAAELISIEPSSAERNQIKPRETSRARSTLSIFSADKVPIFSLRRRLSNVLSCSSSATDAFFSPDSPSRSSICVGNLAFVSRLVTAHAIIVGEYLFPTSFCIISTGRTPPCSLPITGLRSA